MKKSIKHLPKRTQEELNTIIELVTRNFNKCEMIILFGSYARGNYVLWDTRMEFGSRTTYQSDLDILVVTNGGRINITERRLREIVSPKYNKIFEHRRHPSVGFIAENIKELNRKLRNRQYFFSEIIKDGIKIYDTGNFTLDKAGELSFAQIKEIAESEYNIHFPRGLNFLKHATNDYKDNELEAGAFQLHQACEKFYNATTLTWRNHHRKNHKLKELGGQVKDISRDFSTVFPMNTDFEKRCFDLICRAYIEGRYNKDFVVTKEEYEYLLQRVELLRDITERVCAERFAYYDEKIAEEKKK